MCSAESLYISMFKEQVEYFTLLKQYIHIAYRWITIMEVLVNVSNMRIGLELKIKA